MADGAGGEKTEKPTPQRIKKARKDGQIPRTAELGTWLGMAVASVLLPRTVTGGMETARVLFVQVGATIANPSLPAARAMFSHALTGLASAILPFAVGILLVGTLASAAQGGIHMSSKPVKPSWKKMNPWPGLKRMFGVHGIWEALKALIKTGVLLAALWIASSTARQVVTGSGALPVSTVTATIASAAVQMMRVAAITGLVLAIADYMVVRWQMMKKLRMSKYEILQEHKQAEGDPHMKSRRRSLALSIASSRMMTEVATADVMLVNPTHVAVALKYDPAKGAPRVVAKGAGEVAATLRAKAEEHRVPMVQDIPLTRALHATCDLGQEVPPQLFTAVARVLAFVMQLKTKGDAAGMHRPGFPAPDTSGLVKAERALRAIESG